MVEGAGATNCAGMRVFIRVTMRECQIIMNEPTNHCKMELISQYKCNFSEPELTLSVFVMRIFCQLLFPRINLTGLPMQRALSRKTFSTVLCHSARWWIWLFQANIPVSNVNAVLLLFTSQMSWCDNCVLVSDKLSGSPHSGHEQNQLRSKCWSYQ